MPDDNECKDTWATLAALDGEYEPPAPRSHMADWGIWRESVEKRLDQIFAQLQALEQVRYEEQRPAESTPAPRSHRIWRESGDAVPVGPADLVDRLQGRVEALENELRRVSRESSGVRDRVGLG